METSAKTSVEFRWRMENIRFMFEDGSNDRLMGVDIRMWDDDKGEEKGSWIQTELTLDEMEYLAHKILDAVEFQRKRIVNGILTKEEKEDECTLIKRSLMFNNGDRKAVAKELGISARTLYRKMKEYGIV
jgi:DNA-binding NtrC family response regulator